MTPHPTTDVQVRADVFASGRLPAVCVISGRPATTIKAKSAETPARGAYFGLLLGLNPFLVIRALTVKTVTGGVPLDPESTKLDTAYSEQRSQKLRIGLVTFVVGLALVLFAGYTDVGDTNGVAGWIGFVGAVGLFVGVFTVLFGFRGPATWINPTFDHKAGVVTFHRVHPAFAEALTAAPYLAYHGTNSLGLTGPPAGWHPDPSGRSPFRYWDGMAWTDHVSGPNGPAVDPL